MMGGTPRFERKCVIQPRCSAGEEKGRVSECGCTGRRSGVGVWRDGHQGSGGGRADEATEDPIVLETLDDAGVRLPALDNHDDEIEAWLDFAALDIEQEATGDEDIVTGVGCIGLLGELVFRIVKHSLR